MKMMEKTIKINLGGSLFQIDEEAYQILRQYLQEIDMRLRNTPGGAETIEDIELRIAEIFQSQKGLAGVISKENVEAMMSIVGQPEEFDTSGEKTYEKESRHQSSERKSLYRNPDDTIISGVCGGLGAYLNIEPVWIRIMFILFTFFFGVGFFVYIALWIALPAAYSDNQKREMYGGVYPPFSSRSRKPGNSSSFSASAYNTGSSGSAGVGNAFNEVFKALGRVFFIILRVFLIIVGISFILTGFFAIVSFIMVFLFRYPDYFSTDAFGVDFFYLPDFLNYIVNPAVAPWVMALLFIVIALPLLALIYWGVRMIFWFKARDGIISLIALVLWVISVAALSIILFNEGISFAETGKTSSRDVIREAPSRLYIMGDHKVADLNYDKKISVPEEDYYVYFADENKGLFIATYMTVNSSEDNSLVIDIRKRSMGRSKLDAVKKAEELIYNYKISGDTLWLDDYFTIPAGTRWAFDNVGVNLYIPEGTIVQFDKTTEKMFYQYDYDGYDADYDIVSMKRGNKLWIMTDSELRSYSGR
jgi:phage shock protein PspC (stress-responsive transcriptional regulator)